MSQYETGAFEVGTMIMLEAHSNVKLRTKLLLWDLGNQKWERLDAPYSFLILNHLYIAEIPNYNGDSWRNRAKMGYIILYGEKEYFIEHYSLHYMVNCEEFTITIVEPTK